MTEHQFHLDIPPFQTDGIKSQPLHAAGVLKEMGKGLTYLFMVGRFRGSFNFGLQSC